MFSSLKQLFTDLQDKQAGTKISQLPVKTPLVIYTKFYFILVLVVVISIIYSLVYYIPQIPKFISDSVPEITVSVQDNYLQFNPIEPIKLTSPEGALVIDTQNPPADYSSLPIGVFVFRDHSEVRDDQGMTQKFEYKDLPDFSLSKSQVVSWFSVNKTKILFISVFSVIIVSLVISGFVLAFRILGFYLWSGAIFVILNIFKRHLEFNQILPIVVYASILPLLISYILFFAPHPLLSFLNFALFVFFTLSWLLPLTKPSENKKLVKRKK